MKNYIETNLIKAEPQPDYNGMPGCKVIYENGYESWLPKEVFEKAYRKIDGMNFGMVIEALKNGLKVVRNGWNGKGMWIELQVPDTNSKMTRPYIYMVCPKGSTKHFGDQIKDFERFPWVPGQTDILSEDWKIIK